MSNRLLTKAEFNARCKEFADKLNAGSTPKKVWISDMGGWFATESSCDIPYMRADIVDGLIEPLKILVKSDFGSDGWTPELDRVGVQIRAALQVLEEE